MRAKVSTIRTEHIYLLNLNAVVIETPTNCYELRDKQRALVRLKDKT